MKRIIYTTLLLTCLSISYYAFTSSGGAPSGYAGAPGDAGTCGNVGCHGSTPITSGTNWSNFTITTNVPANGYTPGVAYTVTISHSIAGINKWGFESVVLSSSNTQAGTITAGTGTQTGTSGSKTYVTHTSSSNTGTGTRSWSFTWTAPSVGVGDVTIYAAVNAADGNGSANSGDQIYTKSLVVSQFTNFPSAVIDGLPANGYVCLGDTLYLAGSGINTPTDFSWTFTGLPASTDQNPAVIFTSIGSKTITLVTTNTFGSSATNIKTVNVVNKPSASLLPAGTTVQKCGNDSVTLSTTANSAFSFLWSPGNQTTSSIRVRDTGLYSATVTNPLTGCFVHTNSIQVNQLPTPVAVLSTSADTICVNDSITLSSNIPFTNYRFLDDKTTIQNGALSSYRNKFSAGVKQLGLVVTGANGCKSDTAKKQVVVLAPLAAPVVSCGPKTTSSVTFNWSAVANAVAYEVSLDTGHSWVSLPVETLSYTVNGLNPNTNKQLWVRARSIGYCNTGDIGTLICTNGACTPITYSVALNPQHCLLEPTDSVIVPITISNLNISQYGISFDNLTYGTSLSKQIVLKVGAHPIHLRIVDSNALGCPRIDTNLILMGLNPIVVKPIVATKGSLCMGDSAIHQIEIRHTNTGASYYDLYETSVAAPFARLNANADSVLVFSTLSSASPILNQSGLYTIATDTLTGCSKPSDTLVVNVFEAPVVGFGYARNGLELTLTDTNTISTNRNWYFEGVITDEYNAQAIVTKILPVAGVYAVWIGAKDQNGCYGYSKQDIELFNTGIRNGVESSMAVTVFPNPAIQKISIDVKMESFSPLTVEVFDLKGERILNQSIGQPNNEHHFVMDANELSPGMYFIKLTSNAGSRVEKLLIGQ